MSSIRVEVEDCNVTVDTVARDKVRSVLLACLWLRSLIIVI